MIGKQVLAFGKSEKSEFIYIGSFGLSGVTHIWGPNIGRSRRNCVRSHVCCNHPKICRRWQYHRVICPKDADRMTNSRSSLIRIYTVCPDLSVWKLRIITVVWAALSKFGTYRICEQHSLARTSAARSYKQWVRRNLQTESQIAGPSEWLGMHS